MCKQIRVVYVCGHEVDQPIESCNNHDNCGEPNLIIQRVQAKCPSCGNTNSLGVSTGAGTSSSQPGASSSKSMYTGPKLFGRSTWAFPGTTKAKPPCGRGRGSTVESHLPMTSGPKIPRGRGYYYEAKKLAGEDSESGEDCED